MSTTSPDRETVRTTPLDACPVVQALEVVATPRRVQILYALRESELRFNELKRATGARSKTVSDALDVLAETGLVVRRTEEAAPVAVYYGLTEDARRLLDRLDGVNRWAVEWMEAVEDSGEADRLR